MGNSDRKNKLAEAEYSTRQALEVVRNNEVDDFELAKAQDHLEHAAEKVSEMREAED